MSRAGIPLQEALSRHTDPELWKQMESLKDRAADLTSSHKYWGSRAVRTGNYFDPVIDLEERILFSFLEKLRTGELVAMGYDRSRPLASRSKRIPTALWYTIKPDPRDSSASGGGIELVGVLVTCPTRPTVQAEASCGKWLEERIAKGFIPPSRKKLFEEAQSQFGEELSERAFERLWRSHAPPSWTTGGRKPRRSRSSSNAECTPLGKPTEKPRVSRARTHRT